MNNSNNDNKGDFDWKDNIPISISLLNQIHMIYLLDQKWMLFNDRLFCYKTYRKSNYLAYFCYLVYHQLERHDKKRSKRI